MPNQLTKFALLCVPLFLCTCGVPPSELAKYHEPPGPPTDYNPLIKLTSAPDPFMPGQRVTFTASIFARGYKVIAGPPPAILELRAIPGDKDGTPANGGVFTTVAYPGPDTPSWVTATFGPITIPGTVPNGTLAIVVTYKTWRFKQYLPVGGDSPASTRTVYFTLHCGTGPTPQSSVCLYTR